MRQSPINHIKNTREYITSPYESGLRNQSPPRSRQSPESSALGYGSIDGEYWRQRAKQLEGQLLVLNEDLIFQATRIEKMDYLEANIEKLIVQNNHFVQENQNLIRLIQQKNSEIELWKKKFEGQYSNLNIAEAEKKKVFDHLNIKDQEHQIQIQKLLSELDRLQNEATEAENMRKIEITALKNRYENEAINQIQNLKRSQYGNNEIQELNIRKLKDIIEQKNFEIENQSKQAKLEKEKLVGEINFHKNEIKNLNKQKQHEINLLKAEHDNNKANLVQAHRKKEDQLKNLHEAKVKRLSYEIEEKKNEIEESNGRLKRTGKQNQSQLNRLVGQNSKIRVQTKENDNQNRQKLKDLTAFYENQFKQEREASEKREKNLSNFYDGEIKSLNQIIIAKQAEIQRLLELNRYLKQNQELRLSAIKSNNDELKAKIQELIKHYERQIELTKIKISELYEADLEALRSNMKNNYSVHCREADNLRQQLAETREKLANEVQDRLELRKDYELRLMEFKVKYQRQHQQLSDLIALHEKQIEGATSKASLTHIQHNTVLQTRNKNMKELMNEKRVLQSQIQNKNKEIEALNLRIQSMLGFHKRDIQKLQNDLAKSKNDHQQWLQRQDQQTKEWNAEKDDLKARIAELTKKLEQTKKSAQSASDAAQKKINQNGLLIAKLNGQIQELKSKVNALYSQNQVEASNIEKTNVQNLTLMNNEKEVLLQTKKKERMLVEDEHDRRRSELANQIDDLKHQNELLLDNYKNSQIREANLQSEINKLLESVNQRNKLEEHVINIGLSNNYFKNVAQIFKRTLSN